MQFAKLVQERTGGQVRIEIFPAGQLGNDGAILSGTRGGVIDLALTGNPFFAGINPRQSALDLPGIIRTFGHAYKVLDGPIGNEIRVELEQYNFKGLGFLEIGFRNLTNSRRPVVKLEDMAGLKIRTTPNPSHIKAFQLVGVNPVPMPYTEVFNALETRTVDGQENPITLIQSAKFYEVQKYLTLTQHAYTAAPFVMNLKKFQALSAGGAESDGDHRGGDHPRPARGEPQDRGRRSRQAEGRGDAGDHRLPARGVPRQGLRSGQGGLRGQVRRDPRRRDREDARLNARRLQAASIR